jgi:hypothetical protein
MRTILAAWGLLLLPTMSLACDVCGIFIGLQPHDRTSSVSLLWRMRLLEGYLTTPALLQGAPKHGGHGVEQVPLTGQDHYKEVFQVLDARADIWLGQRVAVLASVPMVNNYRAVNGFISTDIYGVGDPLLIGRYLVANTRCNTPDERTAHRLMLGAGAKMPLGRNDLRFQDVLVPVDLQPGTRTWDLLGSVEYMVRRGRNGASVTMIGRHNGTTSDNYRLGHGLSTTAELFCRWDVGEQLTLMPSLGMYHELSGRDAEDDRVVFGTGSSTWFAHLGSRVWWHKWMLMLNVQYAAVRHVGELMVPNRLRIVGGVTYNLIRN